MILEFLKVFPADFLAPFIVGSKFLLLAAINASEYYYFNQMFPHIAEFYNYNP